MILQLVRESCVLGVAPRTEGKTPFHGLARALLQRGFGAFSYFKFSPPPAPSGVTLGLDRVTGVTQPSGFMQQSI